MDFMDWVRQEERAGNITPPQNFIHPLERPFYGQSPELNLSNSVIENIFHGPPHPPGWKFSPESSGVPSGFIREQLQHEISPNLPNKKYWKLGLLAAGSIGLAGIFFSGKDDNYNNIEGLLHGGSAQQSRKKHTEFGSGWDPLRKLVTEHLGSEAGVFENFIKSSSFQESLSNSKVIKTIGSGSFGSADLMKSNITLGNKELPFQFIRKSGGAITTENMFQREVQAFRELGDLNAPTLYGTNKHNQIYMEHIQGELAHNVMLRGDKLSPETVEDLSTFIGQAHSRGYAHTDITRDVSLHHASTIADVQYSKELVPHNIIVTPEGRAGVIDWGEWHNPTDVGARDAQGFGNEINRSFNHYLGEEGINRSAADLDNALVDSLKRQQGVVSKKHVKYTPKIISGKSQSKLATVNTQKAKFRKLEMSATQRATTKNLFETGRSGGKRSKSVYNTIKGI